LQIPSVVVNRPSLSGGNSPRTDPFELREKHPPEKKASAVPKPTTPDILKHG
jgi:hypothetical protein